jgi:hypothetical protein
MLSRPFKKSSRIPNEELKSKIKEFFLSQSPQGSQRRKLIQDTGFRIQVPGLSSQVPDK